jgi:hypothetical protein
VGARSSIRVTKPSEADLTKNLKLISGAMCHQVNTDSTGKAIGVSYDRPSGAEEAI